MAMWAHPHPILFYIREYFILELIMLSAKICVQEWGVFLVLTMIGVGCVVVRQGDFNFHNAGKVQGSNLRLDGYYYSVERVTSSFESSLYIKPVLFWKDRTAMVSSRVWTTNRRDTVGQAKSRFENSIDSVIRRNKRSPFSWGKFYTEGDSIRIKVMRYTSGLSNIIAQMIPVKYDGVILNDTTFILERTTVFDGPSEGTYKYETKYHFCPLDEGKKPPSNNWTQTHPELQ